ncbi:MAG: transporter ATP-binding protein [Microbacteriaceae bacterium]|nr:transporter ATP-binding protein [Microbacteriaceae bacterium]
MSRNRASAKAAGTRFESLVAEFLAFRLADDRVERRAKSGAKDRGDIGGVRTIRGGRVVIECKDTARDNLPGWIREAEVERGNDDAVIGVVAHKKHGSGNPADQYVSMTLETFARLLEGGGDDRPVVIDDPMTEVTE